MPELPFNCRVFLDGRHVGDFHGNWTVDSIKTFIWDFVMDCPKDGVWRFEDIESEVNVPMLC